jgi:hypothetical protein
MVVRQQEGALRRTSPSHIFTWHSSKANPAMLNQQKRINSTASQIDRSNHPFSSSQRSCRSQKQKENAKTYNRRDSQMVTHSSTSRPVQCLCMAERTGCPALTDLWSYVLIVLTSAFRKCGILAFPKSIESISSNQHPIFVHPPNISARYCSHFRTEITRQSFPLILPNTLLRLLQIVLLLLLLRLGSIPLLLLLHPHSLVVLSLFLRSFRRSLSQSGGDQSCGR